jgi:hypothetical protein
MTGALIMVLRLMRNTFRPLRDFLRIALRTTLRATLRLALGALLRIALLAFLRGRLKTFLFLVFFLLFMPC